MTSFQTAAKTIELGLRSAQIGQPVAARVLVHDCTDDRQVEPQAAVALATVSEWFGRDVDRLTVHGGGDSGHLTLLASFTGGETALISTGKRIAGRSLLAVNVWGNRGMLSWEGDGNEVVAEIAVSLTPKSHTLLDRIRQSLHRPSTICEPAKTQRPADVPPRKSQSPPYGVLLISGDETHQPTYAAELAADNRCRLIGLTDEADVPERRRVSNHRLAARLGIPVFENMAEAIARDDVHIVSVCAEPYRRGRIAAAAAAADKHLYLDKPLAGSIAETDAIVAAAAKSGIVTHMFSLVHSPSAQRVRALIQSGKLGTLTAIHFDLCFAKGAGGTAALGQPRKESSAPERFELPDSKRELTNVGVYSLVGLLTLVAADVLRVTATTGNYFFREHQQNGMEDFGQLLLELDGGCVASISSGRTGWQSHPGGGLNRVFLIGTKGSAAIDAHRPRVEAWADVDPWRPPDRDPDDPMGMWATLPGSPFAIAPRQSWVTPPAAAAGSDAAHFLDCIEHGRDSMVPAELAAAATEILLAGYQSAATGRTVELPRKRMVNRG